MHIVLTVFILKAVQALVTEQHQTAVVDQGSLTEREGKDYTLERF